jgi:hypothetical protein
MDAKEEIRGCITGRMPAGEDNKMTRDIVATIEKRVKDGISFTYLLPKFPDRLSCRLSVYKGRSTGPVQQLPHGP